MKNGLFPKTEHFDKEVINSTLQKISENETKELEIHFVYAGDYYYVNEDKLRSIILEEMKKYKIKFVMVTSINLRRWELISKEVMESYCKGEKPQKDSVNDDLESLFGTIRLGEKLDEKVRSYFLPKLTEEELDLVERRDPSYFQTFQSSEMMLSETDSKYNLYVKGISRRKTFVIENSSENSYENSSENQSLLENCNCSLQ